MPASAASILREFTSKEAAGGLLLVIAAAAAMTIANSGLSGIYVEWLAIPVSISAGAFAIDKSSLLWINDALMALFFFLIGLEVKREILGGQLGTWQKAALPVYAALGGMAMPALVFVAINTGHSPNMSGWAIPAATDIAFALGVLALLGSRVPVALKALLLAMAIIDDIGAILVIALFYTDALETTPLLLALMPLAAMVMLNRSGVARTLPYALLAAILWVCVLKSGVHATLAGVAAALTIPMSAEGERPLERIEHALHPWIAFLVLPVFAFANADVDLRGIGLDDLLAPLPFGIAAGLIIGKQLGVFGFAVAAVKMQLATRPSSTSWAQIYGLSCLAGIGFTMSLFIGGLAFSAPAQIDAVKVGVLAGSLVSAAIGLVVLVWAGRTPNAHVRPSPIAASHFERTN